MGVGYTIIPLGELADDPDNISWLRDEIGLEFPDHFTVSRYPTPNELRSAVESLQGHRVGFSRNGNDLDVDIQDESDPGSWANIWMRDYYPDQEENTPHVFFFHRGAPELVIRVVEKLARHCGPFVVTADGNWYVVVTEGTTPNAQWFP